MQNLKREISKILDSEYKYALLILLERINDCIDKVTFDKLLFLQIISTDLNNIYNKYGETEELLDYIYSETNELLELYHK